MTTAAITDAEEIVRKSVFQALGPLMTSYREPDGATPRLYWKLAKQSTPGYAISRPYVVYQPQGDILDQALLNTSGITTPITVKAVADTPAAAAALLATVAPGMLSLAIPAGYSGYSGVVSQWLRSPNIPPLDGVWTAAHTYQVTFYRS